VILNADGMLRELQKNEPVICSWETKVMLMEMMQTVTLSTVIILMAVKTACYIGWWF